MGVVQDQILNGICGVLTVSVTAPEPLQEFKCSNRLPGCFQLADVIIHGLKRIATC